MVKIAGEIQIRASMDEVLRFLSGPENLTEIWSHVPGIPNMQPPNTETDGQHDGTREWGARRYSGAPAPIGLSPHGRLSACRWKGLNGAATWTLHDKGFQTQVTLELEYEIPASLHHIVRQEIVVQLCKRDVDVMLWKLKNRVELERVHA